MSLYWSESGPFTPPNLVLLFCLSMAAKRATAAAADETPSPAAAERRRLQDASWLATLSEPELDFLICLRDLAATRARNAGHPKLAEKFDLRTLRALGTVLLESFKGGLKERSIDPKVLESLALLSDSDVQESNPEAVGPKEDCPMPSAAKRKRKQMWDGLCEEGAKSRHKRKTDGKE